MEILVNARLNQHVEGNEYNDFSKKEYPGRGDIPGCNGGPIGDEFICAAYCISITEKKHPIQICFTIHGVLV